MLAKKTSKNLLTLPKEIAEKFPGTDYFDVRVGGNRFPTFVQNSVDSIEFPGLFSYNPKDFF